MVTGYKNATFVRSPFFSPGRPSWVTRGGAMWIVLHGTASGISYPASSTANDFATNRGASTHYIVGYDGSVYQCVDENDTAWGNGPITGPSGTSIHGGGPGSKYHDAWWDTVAKRDANSCTISIEHSKSTDNQSALSDKQKAASFALIADIRSRWGKYIPVQWGTEKGGLVGHYSMDPVNRSFCPGPYPWTDLFNYLGGHNIPGVSGNEPTGATGGSSGETATGTSGITYTPSSKSYSPLLGQVHQSLVNNAGFYGMALAVDEVEQFPGWVDLTTNDQIINNSLLHFSIEDPVSVIRSVGATIADNFIPFLVRSGVFSLGALLLIMLLYKTIMDSGLADSVPTMYGGDI